MHVVVFEEEEEEREEMMKFEIWTAVICPWSWSL